MNLAGLRFALAVVLGLLNACHGYRVLGIYGLPVRSHFQWFDQLFKGLVRKGHQVDVVSALPMTNKEPMPNYTQIVTFPPSPQMDLSFETIRNFSRNQNLSLIADYAYKACLNMGHPDFLKLARNPPKDPPYDVIITHMFSYHCFMILGHLWNVPVVLVSTSALYPWMHDMVGNPESVAFSPNNLIAVPAGQDFYTRFWNAYYFYLSKYVYLSESTNQNELLVKHFGPNVPSVRELERSVALVLINTYFPINGAKPMAKSLVEVGGLHVQNQPPDLSPELKKWLDESKAGVIYFNLGSILRIETFPKDMVGLVFSSMKKLAPMRVLMRVAKREELSVEVPSNVYTLPWMPQEKVLQHPNVRLFVTHGGLLGTQESIFYGVPMLCLPVMADQFTNTQNYLEKKIALSLDVYTMTEQQLDQAINEIVKNPIYRDNVGRLSGLFRDRPLNAMDTAVYWIEYVVRNGKDSLRSPLMNLTWWQAALLDVLAVVILTATAAIIALIYLIKLIIRLLLSNNKMTTRSMRRKKKN